MKEEFVEVWNVSHLDDDDIELKNRTNNALERYNRHFNGIVPRNHPNLMVFTQALRQEADRIVQRMDLVRRGLERVDEEVANRVASTIEIPDEFHSFETPKEAGERKKKKKKNAARRPRGAHG